MKPTFSYIKCKMLSLAFILLSQLCWGIGEPSTYFNIFIPPNAENTQRNVCIVVTAIYDSTSFSILDDGMDGDTDDSKTGILMAGQSYILYIKDNGVNDDAKYASGGVLKQDGDYLFVTANKLIYTSQSTDSDWQHNWVPATSKSGIGKKFIIYAPKTTNSNRDINIFPYENNTSITIRKISKSATTITGYTNVDIYTNNILVQKTLNIGQDLIYSGTEGRNLMNSGDTYIIEANKSITVQYGALYINERDGGGYVPSINGSAVGDLFYFAVPFQSGTNGEQEIRIVSIDPQNNVYLERFQNGSWVVVKNWVMNNKSAVDWVGKANGNINYNTIFRVSCTNGKKVSVFEANWLETGNPGTSDIGTMCSSFNGTSSGNEFIVYVPPPGNEYNVKNPFTNTAFGQQLSHLYLFAGKDTSIIEIKDLYTNGLKFKKTVAIAPNRYADCYITLSEWKAIYNNNGTTSGPERPYLYITSNKPISLMNTNFNDNWMMYMGSSMEQSFKLTSISDKSSGIPGDTINITTLLNFTNLNKIDSVTISVATSSGASIISSTFEDKTNSTVIPGEIKKYSKNTLVTFPIQAELNSSNSYEIKTKVIPGIADNQGDLVTDKTVVSVETLLGGKVNGIYQQASTSEAFRIESSNTSNLMFTNFGFNEDLTNSWAANTVDINGDGWDDIFVSEKDQTKPNLIYLNNKNSTFQKTAINGLTTDKASTTTSTWADYNNDGKTDVLVINSTQKPCVLYAQGNELQFHKSNGTQITNHVGYYHNGAFVDYDNDGWLDIFLSNYMPTRFNELYKNNKDGTFTQILNNPIVNEAIMSVGSTWADYDNDGDQDLFMPNANNAKNMFFINNGNGTFRKAEDLDITSVNGNYRGSAWGDVNNDGWLDLFITNTSGGINKLFINDKNGNFTLSNTNTFSLDIGNSHGCAFADMDNDMDLDLYVTNDIGIKFLYLNDGLGNFNRKKGEFLEANYGKSFGQCWFDADKDGDLDVFIPTHSNNPNFFVKNNGNNNNWVSIKLKGSISNKDAIGARIKVKCGTKWQTREINSQSGLGGQNSLRAHFGLGNNSIIDSLEIKWPSGYIQYVTNITINEFITIVEPDGALVRGYVYHDKNNNCAKDENENNLGNYKIMFGNNLYAITDKNGYYEIHLKTGGVKIEPVNNGYWQKGCGQDTLAINSINENFTLNLAMTPLNNSADISVDIGLSAMRRGFKNLVHLNIENKGTKTARNITVKLSQNNNLTIVKSSPNYNVVTNNEYIWYIDSMAPGKSLTYELQDSLNKTTAFGTPLQFILSAQNENDSNINNNISLKSSEVVGAIDPNDILVSPKGEGDEGFIPAGTILTYTIRFQNVGTYMASNINIESQLNDKLNHQNIFNITSSHNYQFELHKNGLLVINFININLPDSTVDVMGSNGYFTFSVPILENCLEGDIITCYANIQFDYEDALQTNTVSNKILNLDKDFGIIAYPNPATSSVTIKFTDVYQDFAHKSISSINIYNTLGELYYYSSSNLKNLDIAQIPNGIYILAVSDNLNKTYKTKLIIQK